MVKCNLHQCDMETWTYRFDSEVFWIFKQGFFNWVIEAYHVKIIISDIINFSKQSILCLYMSGGDL